MNTPSMLPFNLSQMSVFIPYSLGRVLNHKAAGDDRLLVYPIEQLPFVSGDLTSNPVDMEVAGHDIDGVAYTDRITTDTSIEARWFPFGQSNRQTPPDMRRNEEVILYRLGDSDTFFWADTGRNKHLRRLETVIIAFSATRDESVTALTPENSYYFEVSTHEKRVTFETSKADGEAFKYSIQLDIKRGQLTITDDINNFIILNSKRRAIMLQNADQSRFNLIGNNIELSAKGRFSGSLGGNYTFKAASFTFTGNLSVEGSVSVSGKLSCSSLNCAGVASVGQLISSAPIVAPNV